MNDYFKIPILKFRNSDEISIFYEELLAIETPAVNILGNLPIILHPILFIVLYFLLIITPNNFLLGFLDFPVLLLFTPFLTLHQSHHPTPHFSYMKTQVIFLVRIILLTQYFQHQWSAWSRLCFLLWCILFAFYYFSLFDWLALGCIISYFSWFYCHLCGIYDDSSSDNDRYISFSFVLILACWPLLCLSM